MQMRNGLLLLATAATLALAGCATEASQPAANPTGQSSATQSADPASDPTEDPTDASTSDPASPPANVKVPETTAQLLAFVQGGAQVGTSAYTDQHGIAFQTPSGNIGCGVWDQTSVISCYAQETTNWPPNPKPSNCDWDWSADTLNASATGVTRGRCAGDPPYPFPGTAKVLPYGKTIIIGQLGCRSEQVGVGCIHLSTGYGFFIARELYKTYGPLT